MKSIFILFLSVLTFTGISAQIASYSILQGEIDKYPVTMELIYDSNPREQGYHYNASYYYHSQEIPIDLYQVKAKNSDSLILVSWYSNNDKETFKGIFQNNVYKGIWESGERNLPFELKKVSLKNYTEIVHFEAERIVPIVTDRTNDSIAGSYKYNFYLPKDMKLQQELVQQVDSTYHDFQTYSKEMLDLFEEDYQSEISESLKGEGEIYPSMYSYQFIEYFSPMMNTEKYLVMAYSNYQYTGGAHGMSFEVYYTYDKRKNKWLEISDILDVKHTKEINNILDKVVRKEHNIPAGMKLNEPENTPFLAEEIYYSENFSLSKKGITFHYGLYEMTPYAYGYFELFVPYDDLKPYLRKDFKY